MDFDPDKYEVVEGTGGVWNYHLTKKDGRSSEALCGERTMICGVLIENWGGSEPDHLSISYCSDCERIASNSS